MSKAGEPLLLDTSVLLHLVRGNETGARIDRMFGLRSRAERALISVITVGECHAFATYRGWGDQKRDALDALMRELVIVDIHNAPVLRAYAEIDTYCKKHGRSVGSNDVWIAATARAASATLITMDKDFDPLDPELIRRQWISTEPERT